MRCWQRKRGQLFSNSRPVPLPAPTAASNPAATITVPTEPLPPQRPVVDEAPVAACHSFCDSGKALHRVLCKCRACESMAASHRLPEGAPCSHEQRGHLSNATSDVNGLSDEEAASTKTGGDVGQDQSVVGYVLEGVARLFGAGPARPSDTSSSTPPSMAGSRAAAGTFAPPPPLIASANIEQATSTYCELMCKKAVSVPWQTKCRWSKKCAGCDECAQLQRS